MKIETALRHIPDGREGTAMSVGFDHRNLANVFLAMTLWLQGEPVQAIERARQAVTDATSKAHPVTVSVAQIWAVSIFMLAGDLESAEEHTEWFIAHAEAHSLAPYLAIGRGFRG